MFFLGSSVLRDTWKVDPKNTLIKLHFLLSEKLLWDQNCNIISVNENYLLTFNATYVRVGHRCDMNRCFLSFSCWDHGPEQIEVTH